MVESNSVRLSGDHSEMKKLGYLVCSATAFAIVLSSSSPQQTAFAFPQTKFRQVEPDVWRGGLPRKNGLERLKKMGVRTIVDLMDEDPTKWRQAAEKLDMKYVNIPTRRSRLIPSASIKQFLAIMEDPANRPIYVHCRSGRDRTGAMIAIYRIDNSNWSRERALKEMRSCGFNPMFTCLSKSVAAFEREQKSPHSGFSRSSLPVDSSQSPTM